MSGNKTKTTVKVWRRLWCADANAWQDVEFFVTIDLDKLPVTMMQRARIKGQATATAGAIKVTKA